MADSKPKRRIVEPETWIPADGWMTKERAIPARQELYGSTRIRLIPKKEEKREEKDPDHDSAKTQKK